MKKTKIAAVAVASVLACGLVAGCDLVTTDPFKDYEQVIAEVDLRKSADFSETGKYAAYKDAIETAEISKRDMVAMFVSSVSSYMNAYGWTYEYAFDSIATRLINLQTYVQYAKVFILSETKPGGEHRFLDENGQPYTVQGYTAAVESAPEEEKDLVKVTYFLTPAEEAKALYGLRVSFNNTLDSLEETVIENRKLSEDKSDDFETTVRTTPTGIETSNEDYVDPEYLIFTGSEGNCGSYERVDGSTVTTRREAYSNFLSNLRSSGLLRAGEDTSKVEELSYFKRELINAYENALVQKMTDSFEDIAAEILTDEYLSAQYSDMLARQRETYADDPEGFTSALDSMSDSSFILAAPKANYGFVINILLPFSAAQKDRLDTASKDADDEQGNKFVMRANILKSLKATDQRGTWFSGETDYSFDGSETEKVFTNGSEDRKYLFFEDSLNGGEDKKYEKLERYMGLYTYNGTVTPPEEGEGNGSYKLTPKPIGIDDFIGEMEGYLNSLELSASQVANKRDGYYDRSVTAYYTKNDDNESVVDYSSFVYYQGHVDLGEVKGNDLFDPSTKAYRAFSVINELSFAYNTDTAGLNKYLGYSVTPDKTTFVSEFEYAAQVVCEAGAGNYIVVPSDYGWHIIYCTFSFKDTDAAFEWIAEDKEKEGTFSHDFYEAIKSSVVSTESSNRQTEIINTYAEPCATRFESRYADLKGLDNT